MGEYEHVCPGCTGLSTFSKGGLFDVLVCDYCGYAPRESVRKEIRSEKATEVTA